MIIVLNLGVDCSTKHWGRVVLNLGVDCSTKHWGRVVLNLGVDCSTEIPKPYPMNGYIIMSIPAPRDFVGITWIMCSMLVCAPITIPLLISEVLGTLHFDALSWCIELL